MLASINFKTLICENRDSEFVHRFSLSKRLFLPLTFFLFAAVTTFAQSNISVSVSPKNGGLTVGQTLSLVATVSNDSSNKGVTWSASGSNCSGATCGTFGPATSASGASDTYTAPSSAGVYTITATSLADITANFSITIGVTDLAGVLTYHNNLSRDGTNPSEYTLTPSNVNATTFGKLFSCTADAAIYAQPLWVPDLAIGGGTHNVVFVGTTHDSVYAFDADSSSCTTYWHKQLYNSGETYLNNGDVASGDIEPDIGIIGTPVIDLSTKTLYVVSKSKVSGTSCTPSSSCFQRLHALSLLDGSEKFGGPYSLTSSITVPGTGDGSSNGSVPFDPLHENQRPGLALVNGVVYIAWASHGDNGPYHGWVIGFAANNIGAGPSSVWNSTPNFVSGSSNSDGGIWMSGGAPAADSSNDLYFLTGNGSFDANSGGSNYGDSTIRLTASGGLHVKDYFTPGNQDSLRSGDADHGAGGAAVLVDPSSGPVPHLLIGGGKSGTLFMVNRDNMGKYSGGPNNPNTVVQSLSVGSGIFATPAFWNNFLYIAGIGGHLNQYAFNTTSGQFALSHSSSHSFAFPGSTPTISSLGTSNGIVWALDNSQYCTEQSPGCGPAVLHAFDATNVSAAELWNSSLGVGNAAGNAVKFTVPTVANGKVYIGTRGNNTGGTTSTIPGELVVYGLLSVKPQAAPPTFTPPGGSFTSTQPVSISDAITGAAIYYTTDNSTPSPGVGTTTVYSGSFNVTATTTVKAMATASGYINSAVASATYTLQAGGGGSGPSIRVRAGTSASYTDPSGNVWTGDVDYVGGTAAVPITHAISNTTTQPLYQTERYNGFTYTFTGLPVGSSYAVTLKFSENYWAAAGKRMFNVILNGATVLSNFDIFADAGGEYIADDKTFSTTVNSQGQIVIQFQNGSANNAKIDAIQLVPSGPTSLPAPQISPGSETFTGSVPVSISDAITGAAIYYTTDNSTPSPGVGTTTVYSGSFNVTATTTVKAMATASGYINSAVASATYTLQAGGGGSGPSIRVRAGTSASYTDPSGNVWTGDVDYVGGTAAVPITHAISNTTTQPLYQTERYNGFTYTFTGLPVGSSYAVTLKFSENYWAAAGKRMFNVILNGATVLSNFDIFADAGGEYIADDKTFSTTVNSQGQIVIQFQNGSANNAKIDAIQLVPSGPPSIRVRAGTSASYTDPSGNVWTGDVDYVGGTAAVPITHAISNTTTQPLYQTERYNGFTYTFTGLPVGSSYAVTLKFSENYWAAAGKRMFNVILNGATVLSNFDIFADAGGEYIADDKTFSTTVNSQGQIVIQFQNGSANNAKIDAIQLVPSGG